MKVIIFGSRTWGNHEGEHSYLCTRIYKLFEECDDPDELEIIVGGAGGADTIAEKFCEWLGLKCSVFKSDWGLGGSAGMKRNRDMRREKPALAIGFWDGRSPGTKGMIAGLVYDRINHEIHRRNTTLGGIDAAEVYYQ